MSDITIGFRTSDTLKEKTHTMIDSSGLTKKQWFEKAVALMEQHELKEGSPDHKSDLV